MIAWSEILRCPECGGNVDPRPTGHEAGWLVCARHRFPFAANIPIFIPIDVTKWIDSGDGHAAVTAILARSANRGIVGRIRNVLGLEPRDPSSFEEGARLLLPERTANYFLEREKHDSYEAGQRRAGGLSAPVVDLGCGAGHLTRALGSQAVGCDIQFPLLFLARRFIAPEAGFVCCDLARSLPFKDAAFGSAFSCDSFNYVADRPGLANEIRRVARSARLVWLHKAASGAHAQPPLTPEEYLRLFPGGRIESVSDSICDLEF